MQPKHFLFIAMLSMGILSTVQNLSSSPRSIPLKDSVEDEFKPQKSAAKIQIVFALDATGSMSGLIAAAKDKIFSIANSITQSKPYPNLEIGFVFYRDRGDHFITRRVPLTDSLDKVYAELMQVRAEGGGDGPESVNQGLYEAVMEFNWSPDAQVYKTVFLVGDFPPHMDYADDVKYPETCILARSKDITLNSILMGNNREAEKVWKEISNCNLGAFVKVDMNVNDVAVHTPYDDGISKLYDSLEQMHYYYGSAAVLSAGARYMETGESIKELSSVNVKAQRADFKMAKQQSERSGAGRSNSLLEDVEYNKVKLKDIPDDHLPQWLRKVDKSKREAVVLEKIAQRKKMESKLAKLIGQRNEYIENQMSASRTGTAEPTLNEVIFQNVQKQAKRKNIELTGKVRY